ncbi:carbohydrate-binding module family 18 protein, partial [Piromyces sp. E2]
RRNVDSALDKPEGVETIINDTYENPEKLEEIRKLFKRQEDKEEKEDEKKDKEEKEKENKNDDIVDDVIKQIHNLISNNKDTYKNPEKLEELLHNKKELRRRNVDSTLDKSNYANVISSSKNHTVITVFLSPILLKEVEALPNILSCIPNRKLKYSSYHYNKKDILQESKWKKVTVRENADRHLSLISQGKYNEKLIDQYDTNYYYPSSSGKDIDIILIDSGFNFEHPEFANKNERTIKCVKQIVNGEAVNPKSNEYCGTLEEDAKYHGESVADVAAGLIHGIANKANVNAIAVEKMDLKNLLGAIDYAKNHLIKPHQTVINIPVMDYFPVDDASTEYIDSLMDEITEKGGIIVNGSGNDGVNMNINNKTNDTIVLPCTSKNVICVGGIDNAGDDRKAKVMNSINYKKAQWSNFGKDINFYAPGSVHVEYYDKNNQTVDTIQEGTSFSASIVTGIIASIMSEHSEIEFTSEKMMDYLTKIGSKNIISEIPEDQPNIFINNGKHVVYSKNNKYNGCGIQAGNKKCGHDKCCSSDGQCRHDIESCKTSNGCQIKYGDCKIVKSSTEGRCGHGFGSCPSGKCCSHNGYCGKSSEHCGLGCQLNYGHCN